MSGRPGTGLIGLAVLALAGIVAGGAWLAGLTGSPPSSGASPQDAARDAGTGAPDVTYSGQVAAILHANCGTCHRPGGAGPFSLLDYENARRRATLIAAVTRSRYMPPWQPSRGREVFANARRLDEASIETLARWAELGAPPGDLAQAPPPPVFSEGWQLGPPDLVVSLPEPFELVAEGVDQFRNFVLPLPVSSPRYVKALEFRPGNARVVHHAVLQVDRSRASRQRDARDPGPGFGGMDMGASENPGGQFIGWTPGKIAVADERLAWRLDPGTDLVVQLHMLPSGKPEKVPMEVGLYFTDTAPSLHPVSLVLRNDDIDIPPGEDDYVIEDDVVLPVPVEAVGIYPHAHYLGKEVEVWADLPGGGRETLIHIPAWDFAWQDDYRYAKPIALPAGAHVHMRYRYDNSAANVRNPHNPPERVRFGNRSSDEMATLTVQVLPASERDRWRLAEASFRRRLERRPHGWYLHTGLGAALNRLGRHAEAEEHFRQAMISDPGNPAPVYNLANTLLSTGRAEAAVDVYQDVLALEPDHPKVRNNLAVAYQMLGRPDLALEQLRAQMELSPRDARVRYNLGAALLAAGRPEAAEAQLREASTLDASMPQAHADLGEALRRLERVDEARQELDRALALAPGSPAAELALGLLDVRHGDRAAGLERVESVVARAPQFLGPLNNEAWWRATAAGEAADPQAALALARVAADHAPEAPEVLDTLAAAHAAAGEFEQAVHTIERAMERARAETKLEYLPEFEARRETYRSGRRHVQSP